MRSATAAALAALLAFAILTVWAPPRWPLAVLQCGVFALALLWAARIAIRPVPVVTSALAIPPAFVVVWILLQLACGRTAYRHDTWDALLVWGADLAALWLALQFAGDARCGDRFRRAAAWLAVPSVSR